jgi:ligand-binding sensor domain-containing protein
VVQSGGLVYSAFPFGYIVYDPVKKELQRKTKLSGLNGSRIIKFAKDPATEKIAVVYSNFNMDIIEEDKVFNIPDIFLKATAADKTVNNLVWQNNLLYVSTNLGIIVVDPIKKEIKDTYKTATQLPGSRINQVALLGNDIYAATSTGIKRTALNVQWPGNLNDWFLETDNLLGSGEYQTIFNWKGNLVVQKKDSVFIKVGAIWKTLYISQKPISAINASGDKLFIMVSINGVGSILQFSSPVESYLTFNSAFLSMPFYSAVSSDGLWVADQKNGLLKISGSNTEKINIDAPADIAKGRGRYFNGDIIASSGSINADWKGELNPNGFFIFDGNNWTNYIKQENLLPDSVLDIVDVVRNAANNKLYAASYGGGLVELDKGKIKIFKQGSPISSSLNTPGKYLISGLAMDQKQNLWITNFGSAQSLLVKKSDDSWTSFNIPFAFTENAVGKIMIDASNRKWIISPKGNGLFCFDDKGTIDQKNDDSWRFFQQGKGRGNLPSSNVLSVAFDRDGFIWVGTDKGIGIIQCTNNIFSSVGCEAILPVVKQDNFNGLLFGEESVNDIAVDGANRKWVATDNGVWLISPDGQQIIYHFNESNSNLLSDHVFQVVVQEKTGEVFFFTENGICSFVGTATEPAIEKLRPVVFPNPVPSGYNGTIAIRGLKENAWVRITELDGKLVYQTRSLGGQAIWNGRTYKGEKISSGVYLVMVSDEFNEQQLATKIFFIK